MAKIKQGILGGFSGSVAGVVGTSWKGRAVMKAKPLSVANPRTTGQVSQRNSFKGVAQLASVILIAVCRAIYNPIAGNISGYNKFTQQNKSLFDGNGDMVVANGKIGGGTLPHDQVTLISHVPGSANLGMNWESSAAAGTARENDKVYGYAVEPISGTVWVANGESTRADEGAPLTFVHGHSDLMGQLQCSCFVGFVSEDGRSVSVEATGATITVDFGS